VSAAQVFADGFVQQPLFKAVAHPSVNTSIEPAPTTNYGWSPVIVGIAICAVLALGGILYSLNAGAGLVLRVAGAVPADPVQYHQWPLLVSAQAIPVIGLVASVEIDTSETGSPVCGTGGNHLNEASGGVGGATAAGVGRGASVPTRWASQRSATAREEKASRPRRFSRPADPQGMTGRGASRSRPARPWRRITYTTVSDQEVPSREKALAVARQALEEIADPTRAWPVHAGGPAQAMAAHAAVALRRMRTIEEHARAAGAAGDDGAC
jgi:hypothetical protein